VVAQQRAGLGGELEALTHLYGRVRRFLFCPGFLHAGTPFGSSTRSRLPRRRPLFQQADRLTVRPVTTPGGPLNTTLSDFTACQDGVLPVTEVEIGTEYTRVWGGFQPFLRAGLVGETWCGAGNAAGAGGNLGCVGLTVTAGAGF